MGEWEVRVWLYDVSDLTWWETSGYFGTTIYANCYHKEESTIGMRHPDFTTLVVL